MTVVSLGDCGTSVPSFFRRSRNARLGCALAACICDGSAAEAVTRSIAAFGHTHTFSPRSAKTPVSARNIRSVKRMSINLDLDGYNLLHDQVADDLEKNRHAGHLIAR